MEIEIEDLGSGAIEQPSSKLSFEIKTLRRRGNQDFELDSKPLVVEITRC
jgi:hypothetical protein